MVIENTRRDLFSRYKCPYKVYQHYLYYNKIVSHRFAVFPYTEILGALEHQKFPVKNESSVLDSSTITLLNRLEFYHLIAVWNFRSAPDFSGCMPDFSLSRDPLFLYHVSINHSSVRHISGYHFGLYCKKLLSFDRKNDCFFSNLHMKRNNNRLLEIIMNNNWRQHIPRRFLLWIIIITVFPLFSPTPF